MKLFELKIGDRFTLQDKTFVLKKFKNKRMPTLGIVLNAIVVDWTGKEQYFIRNWEVERINEPKG